MHPYPVVHMPMPVPPGHLPNMPLHHGMTEYGINEPYFGKTALEPQPVSEPSRAKEFKVRDSKNISFAQ
jgi:hypothetical protein